MCVSISWYTNISGTIPAQKAQPVLQSPTQFLRWAFPNSNPVPGAHPVLSVCRAQHRQGHPSTLMSPKSVGAALRKPVSSRTGLCHPPMSGSDKHQQPKRIITWQCAAFQHKQGVGLNLMGLLLAAQCWDSVRHSRWSNTGQAGNCILLFPVLPDTGSLLCLPSLSQL